MWYVLQTMTGREEELVHYIEEIVPKELYTDCFVAYYEMEKTAGKRRPCGAAVSRICVHCFGYAEGAVPVSEEGSCHVQDDRRWKF